MIKDQDFVDIKNEKQARLKVFFLIVGDVFNKLQTQIFALYFFDTFRFLIETNQ